MGEKMNRIKRLALTVGGVALLAASQSGMAAPGDLVATVTLPGNGTSVGGAMIPLPGGGIAYATPNGFNSSTIRIYAPPPGDGAATLLATKTMDVGQAGGCIAWDPSREVLWAGSTGGSGSVYSVDLGDPTVDGTATATFQFTFEEGGISLCDGMAYDPFNDTLWMSPDVNTNVYEFSLGTNGPIGTLLSTVAPKNEAGEADGSVSGVTVGTNNTLFIARNGQDEVRRVDKTTGAFISNFADTDSRAEDLSCDTVTYAPLTTIITREFEIGGYQAYEVEAGTCTRTDIPPPPGPQPSPSEAVAIPTLSPAGLISLFALLGLGGLIATRRMLG